MKIKIKSSYLFLAVIMPALATLTPQLSHAALPFSPGNLLVFSADSASANNTTFTILELNNSSASQSSAVNSVAINGTTMPGALRCSGSAATTGYLSDSDDGTLLVFAGHNTNNAAGNANTNLIRGVGTLDINGNFTLQTTYTGATGNQTRCATSVNKKIWYVGDQGGIYTNGTTSALNSANARGVKSFGGTVYVLQSSSSAQVLSTLSADGKTLTSLGLGADNTAQDFYLVSSGNNGSTFDLLYILDETSATAGTIKKFSWNGTSWTAQSTYATSFGGFGLCAAKNGTGATLYITTGTGATAANNVVKLTDTAAYNSAISITTGNNVTLYTAAAGTAMKGIAFAPIAYTVTYNGNGNGSGTVPTDANSPYAAGATVTVLGNTGNLVKTGYAFAGWNTATDGSGTTYSANQTFNINANTILFAKWLPTYTVTYDGNGNTGGSVPTDGGAYTNGQIVTILANTGSLVKSSYVFAGWNTAADGSGTFYSADGSTTFVMGSTNATFYAVWTQNPAITISTGAVNFSPVAVNGTSANMTYTVSGANLSANIVINAPANFQISTSSNSGYGNSITLAPSGGAVSPTTIYVQFLPTAQQNYSGDIANTSTGALEQDVAVSGSGANAPAVSTQAANNIATNGANFNGTVTASNNAAITDRGFYYGTSPGVSLSDTLVDEGGTGQSAFSKGVTGLNPNQIYYYRAYAINAIGTTLDSTETSFTTLANTPTAPTVSGPTQTSLNVAVGSSDGNPSTTIYAIQEATSGNYIQANGTLGASAIYQMVSAWGTVTVSGLSNGVFYRFQVEARNSVGTDSAFGPIAGASTTGLTFTPGNLVVERVGNGVETLSGNGNTIFLDELTASGSAVQSLQIPNYGPSALIESGAAGSDGGLTRSSDGLALCFPGYNANQPNSANLTSATGTAVPRGVGIVNAGGSYTLAAVSTTANSANNIRGAATDNNGNYWCSGAGTGINYLGSGTPASVYSTVSNLRCLNLIGTNLWFSTASGSTTRGIWEFTGAPVATATPVQIIQLGANDSVYNFGVDNATNPTTIYYSDDGTQGNGSGAGIHKWTNSAGAWSQAYAVYSGSGVYGLAVDWSTTPATIYATITNSANSLIKIADNGANSAATILATAATGEFYRGIAFAPKGSTAMAISSSENPSGFKDSVTFTATITPSTASGSVIFKTNGVALGTNAISSGQATSAATTLLPRGNNIITAEYAGDSNYLGATNTLLGGQIVTNHPPVISPLNVTRIAGMNLQILWSQITNQWNDADGDTVTLYGFTLTTTNNVTVTTNSQYVLYPSGAPNVADQISYTATDGQGAMVSGVIDIAVNTNGVFGQQSPQLTADNSGQVHVTFYGVPDYTYVMQRSTDLITWTDISTNTATMQNPAIIFTDTMAADNQAYYRLKWQP